MKLTRDAEKNKQLFCEACGHSDDILCCSVYAKSVRCYALWCEGMTNPMQSWEMLFKQVKEYTGQESGEALLDALSQQNAAVVGSSLCDEFEQVSFAVMSGCVVLLANGARRALIFPAQGYSFRSISESGTEENVRGSREAFAEPLRVNMSLVRRRIKSPKLVFRLIKLGTESHTETALAYLSDRVPKKMVRSIEKRLKAIDIELVLESGFIEPFLDDRRHSMFSGVGHTERPDTFCGKLRDGRVGVIVDGTPYALVVPYLFTDNFNAFDDFTGKPYYASAMRILKYIAFFVSFLLPGTYVAVMYFCPEIIPQQILYNIASSQNNAGLPLIWEAVLVHIIYEIIREAGLRLPKAVGHTVGLVGALVVGESAVTVGIVSTPMLLIIALTAISSFMIPDLYEPSSILRLAFIVIGGTLGPAGTALSLLCVLLNISAIDTYGIPYLSPLSPFGDAALNDGILIRSWIYFSKHENRTLTKLPGAHLGKERDEND